MPRLPLPNVPSGVFVAMAAPYPVARDTTRRQAPDVDELDARLERAIEELLDQRRPDASICPSEAARAVDPEGWRELMPAARAAAGRLAAAGRRGGPQPARWPAARPRGGRPPGGAAAPQG